MHPRPAGPGALMVAESCDSWDIRKPGRVGLYAGRADGTSVAVVVPPAPRASLRRPGSGAAGSRLPPWPPSANASVDAADAWKPLLLDQAFVAGSATSTPTRRCGPRAHPLRSSPSLHPSDEAPASTTHPGPCRGRGPPRLLDRRLHGARRRRRDAGAPPRLPAHRRAVPALRPADPADRHRRPGDPLLPCQRLPADQRAAASVVFGWRPEASDSGRRWTERRGARHARATKAEIAGGRHRRGSIAHRANRADPPRRAHAAPSPAARPSFLPRPPRDRSRGAHRSCRARRADRGPRPIPRSRAPVSILRFEKVTREVGAFVILDDVSVAIAVGDRIGLVGPNGAGKTTLLRIAAGRDEPDEGVVGRKRGLTIGLLAQEAHLDAAFMASTDLRSAVRTGRPTDQMALELAAMERDHQVTEPAYAELQHRFDVLGGYTLTSGSLGPVGAGFGKGESIGRPPPCPVASRPAPRRLWSPPHADPDLLLARRGDQPPRSRRPRVARRAPPPAPRAPPRGASHLTGPSSTPR